MSKFSSRAAVAALATVGMALASGLLVASPASAAVPGSHHSRADLIYVSPSGGAHGNGSASRPFGSLAQARDAVRSINQRAHEDIDVILSSGTYTVADTFALTSLDSGYNGHTVTWEAAPGAHPVISGGKSVTGWTLADASTGIYKAHVGNIDTRELWVNGENEPRARGAINPGGFTKTANGYTTTDTSLASFADQSSMEVVSRWGWMLYRCPIQSIVGTTITMQQPCWDNANLHQGQEIQTPTWIENAKEYLDTPGEWYLDKAAGELYYMPKAGQNLAKDQVIIPQTQDLLDLNGTASNPVANVNFAGITFSYSTWLAPSSSDGVVEGQAGFRIVGSGNASFDATRTSWVKTPGAVNVSYGHNIGFSGNTFTHLGAVGLNLNTGSQGTSIVGNIFTDVAATGIQVGGVQPIDAHPTDPRSITKNTHVSNNVVTDVADIYNGSVGILAGYTKHTVIEHNKVYDLPYSGISTGWGWGLTDKGGNANYPGNLGQTVYTTPTTSSETVIRDNDVSNIMQSQADGGAIYTIGSSANSVIEGNYIHGIPAQAYGAIYNDEGSRYYTEEDNALCGVQYQWLFTNHGMDIHAEHNFTNQAAYSTQANSTGLITNNTAVAGCDQLPASIVSKAGLQPSFRHLDPATPVTDHKAPSTPGIPTASASFPTVADLDWAASTDSVGVTGYSIYANGVLVSASKGASMSVPGLTPGKRYTFQVSARDAAANSSPLSRPVSITMPAGTDIAQGKPVTASSTYSADYTPELTVDGDLTTRWAEQSGAGDPSWVEVDLGAPYTISGIVTTFEKTSGYGFTIQTSLDDKKWTTFDDESAQLTTAQTIYSEGLLTGRYIRVTVTNSSGEGASIYEITAYGTPSVAGSDTQGPTAPTNVTVAAKLPTVATLNWNASTDNVGVGSYLIYQDGTQIGSTHGTSFTVNGLKPGTAYSFTVVAQDPSANQSPTSAAASITMPADDDLLKGGTVTASSTYSSDYSPSLVIDGDLSTRWAQASGNPDPSWVEVDMGSVKTLDALVTTFEKSSGYEFKLETSTDGTTWSTFDDHTSNSTTSQSVDSYADAPVKARYVRLTITSSSGNGGSVYEIQGYTT
jgi:chitodextrinase